MRTPARYSSQPMRALLWAGLLIMPAISACLPAGPISVPTPTSGQPQSIEEFTPEHNAPDTTATTTTVVTVTPTPAALISIDDSKLAGTKILFWHPWTGATGETLRTLVDEFNRVNEQQIRVELVAQSGGWDDLENRITGALETSQPPDLSAGFMHQILDWGTQHPVVDLEPYIADPKWGLGPDAPADFYSDIWSMTSKDGRRPAFPLLPSTSVFIYNASWGQELGYRTPPTSLQQFADQTCAAADAYRKNGTGLNDGTGGMIASPDYATALNWISAFGGEVYIPDADGEAMYSFDQPEVRDAFAFLRDLYDEGCIWPTDQPYIEDDFARRAGLFATSSLTDLPYIAKAMQRAGNSDGWAVIPFPSNRDEESISLSGASLTIFASTPERQMASWLLIKWLIQPSNHARLVEANGAYPLRRSEIALLDSYRIGNPQWSMALDLLSNAQPEPLHASWGEVRWALADAFTQLFRSYFKAENIPAMLSYLDQMAAELQTGRLPEDLFTPVPSITP